MGGSSFPESPAAGLSVQGWPRAVLPGWWRVRPRSLRHRLSLEAGEGPADPEWSGAWVGSSHTPEGPSCCLGNAGQITVEPSLGTSDSQSGPGVLGSPGPWGDGGHGLSFSARSRPRCVCTAGAPRRLVARGLRRPLSPEANSEAGSGLGRRAPLPHSLCGDSPAISDASQHPQLPGAWRAAGRWARPA